MTAQLPGLEALGRLQDACLAELDRLPPEQVNQQFHPELSPIGWHVGHCTFVETYWLREQVLGERAATAHLHDLFFPELCSKPSRAARLPEADELRRWAARLQRENLERLADPPRASRRHPLLRGGYLTAFLAQHHAQHLETVGQVHLARALQSSPMAPPAGTPAPRKPEREDASLAGMAVRIGSDGLAAYDNEGPPRRLRLHGGRIARRLVSVADYLAFMAAGGYRDRRHWSEAGWRWLTRSRVQAPACWRPDPEGWHRVTIDGPQALEPQQAVSGLSRHEAEAFARWAGARLPHEYEWEAGHRAGLLEGVGQAWEWCANAFHPYPGFRPFPYDGYSLPWFDGRHFTLRGASPLTRAEVRRSSFRNFYQAHQRHLQAGLRLAWDAA